MLGIELITVEVVSAVACFILVRFMIKPFWVTGESRYLGLPLGFGFLGASYAFSALLISGIIEFDYMWWAQLFFRAFAFLFLLVTYLLSKQRRNLFWNAFLGLIIVIFAFLIILTIISPQVLGPNYNVAQIYVRVFILFCLSYISIHTIKSHLEKPDPTTLIIPLGFILLAIGQFLQIIWVVDGSHLAFWAGLTTRLGGLSVFLFVSYRTFYSSEKRGVNENNPA
jgi:hypothetical protein